jgi:uncharacterized protein YkwD/dienelactone hydrolase
MIKGHRGERTFQIKRELELPMSPILKGISLLLAVMSFAVPAAQSQMQESVEKFRSGGALVTIECFAPSTERKLPAILLLHGGGGLGDDTGGIFREIGRSLAPMGFVVLVPHYFERTKHVIGRNSSEETMVMVEVIKDATDYAASLAIVDPTRIGLVGYSMGSYLAFFRAARDERIKAVASCSGSLPVESKSKFPPVLILQGSKDRSSPLGRIKEFEAVLEAKDTPFASHVYRGLGHNFDFATWDDATRRFALFFGKYLSADAAIAQGKNGTAKQSKVPKPPDSIAAALLSAHNIERKKEGKAPLKLSEKLSLAALAHAKDMAEHHTLDHTGSDKSTVAVRVKREGYVYIDVGENIADGQHDVDDVMATWMESPGHRKNILADFTEMGAARVKDSKGINYWCVDLGTPMPQLKSREAAAALVKYLNEDRKKREKPLLKTETRLGKAAVEISALLAEKDTSKLEGDPFKLIKTEAPRGRELRILLSGNAPTHVEVAKSLLGDEAADLDDFREIGVGYATAKSGTPYWCTILGKPILEKPRAVRIRERQDQGKSDEP